MKKISILILLLFTVILTASASKYKYNESRTVIKDLIVSSNPSFESDTKYANVIITHSTVDKIQIKMVITTSSNNPEIAKKMLDLPVYQINKTSNGAYLSCTLNSELNKQYNNWGNFNIKYYISVPANTKFKCTTKYGDIDFDKADGTLTANVKYGNLNVNGTISGDETQTDVQYGNINLKDVDTPLKVMLKYGDLIAENCQNINIESKYSNISINEAYQINGIGKYDDYKIGKVNSFVFSELDYTNIKIKELVNQLSLSSLRYASLIISEVQSNFKSINIPGAAYADIKLTIPNKSFKINAKTSYATVKVYNLHNAESVSATIGSGNPESTIAITNKYGDITIQ